MRPGLAPARFRLSPSVHPCEGAAPEVAMTLVLVMILAAQFSVLSVAVLVGHRPEAASETRASAGWR